MVENMGSLRRTNMCGNLRSENIGEEVTLMGWVQRERNLGSIIFIDLRDTTGISQVVIDDTVASDIFEKASKIRSEFVIAVRGKIRERQSKNEEIPTGDVEVLVEELKILNVSETPPIYVKDDDNVSDNMRLKYRYLDLRKPSMQNKLKLRAKTGRVIREFLDNNSFVEIETPMLTKPTPEGARDYLVPSRVNPGKFYALPQSPQQMKQLLMVSGMDRYYQITKCFRDEDLRSNRQPEFTQVDIEMSFVDVEDILNINEKLIAHIFKEMKGVDISLPIRRMTYKEAMDKYGVDKPDLRFGYEIVDLTEVLNKSDFKVFSENIGNGGVVKAIKIDGAVENFSSKGIKKLESFVKDYGAKGLVTIKMVDGEFTSGISKFLTEEEIAGIVKTMEAKDGDIIFLVSDKYSVVCNSLGNLRNKIARDLEIIDLDELNLLWITEFPLFEFDEDENRYVAVHHPFTSPMDEDIEFLESDPARVRAKAYDIVMNGDELGGGSIRINNSQLQNQMFKLLGFNEEQTMEQFGHLIEAFKYGTPPHGGIAYGFDRLTMLLCGTENIRDVIAFPKTQAATDLMMEAPTMVSKEQLKELSIDVDLD